VAAVVDGRTTLRRIVHSAEILPLGSAHFETGGGTAGRVVGEEVDDYGVRFLDQEAGEFIEPDFFAGVGGWLTEFAGEGGGYGVQSVGVGWVGVRVVEGFEVFG
jgi:hypothetical protein